MSSSTPKLASGIQEKDNARVIPMSVRADGSVRKERRVRPGYTPPEDVAKYTNRVLDAVRPTNSISSLAPPAKNESNNTPKTKAQIKNEKRKAKRKEDGATNTDQAESSKVDSAVKTSSTEPSSSTNNTTNTATTVTPAITETTPVDPEKKLRALNKKLRQAEQLKVKQEHGEELLPEQQEKVSKISELMTQIAELQL